ncbi:hypothetical protein [Lewinella sp. W8]|uniref:hypothetical protein n=1 Tax=Lewinella sp. W8 TaxID=2528208 RepID=UPI0010673ACD|nr:hypothetical protein [Lewinella sp. W8]MTB53095.1 hypothetical protein [Lewinella sp. W8]
MRTLFLALFSISVIACSGTKQAAPVANTPPAGLSSPEYDPANSPTPMSANTPLPAPAPAEPSAYSYPSASQVATKGVEESAAPATYGSSVALGADAAVYTAVALDLEGLWVNTTDDREEVEFALDHYTTFFEGEQIIREPMTFHLQCPGECSGGVPSEFSCFTVKGPAGQDCYGIIRLTDDILELSMLGVSTETVVYRKKR